ncbi:hypothetical protein OPW39_15700 [Vibrio europaeus]|uniref:hypothetical protein n=1 Tax=Vibrio europaeus TaxID=300876 RepID=UPI00233F5EE5|nr:hypothetical protein [Vibrio europaeus]MDC5870252.1 hypothetical protein [Vibrio europaeus]
MILELMNVEKRAHSSYEKYFTMLGHMPVEFWHNKKTGKLSIMSKHTLLMDTAFERSGTPAKDVFLDLLQAMNIGDSCTVLIRKPLQKELRDIYFKSFVGTKVLTAKSQISRLVKTRLAELELA